MNTDAEMAKQCNLHITAIWVKSKLPYYPETVSEISGEQAAAEAFLDDLKNDLKDFEIKFVTEINFYSVAGNPSKTIVSYAKKIILI